MRNIIVEGSPFIGYGLLDFKGLSLGLFSRSLYDNGIYVVGSTVDFLMPAVCIASVFEQITETVVGKVTVHI